jgi:hypothetical protein
VFSDYQAGGSSVRTRITPPFAWGDDMSRSPNIYHSFSSFASDARKQNPSLTHLISEIVDPPIRITSICFHEFYIYAIAFYNDSRGGGCRALTFVWLCFGNSHINALVPCHQHKHRRGSERFVIILLISLFLRQSIIYMRARPQNFSYFPQAYFWMQSTRMWPD